MSAKDEDEREDDAKAKKAEEADLDEDESEDETSEEDADDDDSDDESEDASKDDEDASDEDDESDDDENASDEDEDEDDDAERDASTRGVAKALGVDEDEEGAGEDGETATADSPAQNRASRRRADAEKRRQERVAKRRKADGDDEDDGAVAAREALPKDKNARAKELLKRRQEAAEGNQKIGLSAGEVVQDQLARAGSGIGRWFQKNVKVIVGVGGVAIAATIGGLYWLDHQDQVIGKASDDLARGLTAERGLVMKEDKRTDEQKKQDPTPVFATVGARADAELEAFGKVVADRPGSGAGIVARLAQAGAYLDKGDADQAVAACDDVLGSELAKADIDVRGRALEIKGFALEAKKDLEGALAVFKELESSDKNFEDLGRYHQARMLLAKGQTDEAKAIFVAIDKKLEVPTLEGPQHPELRAMVDEYLRQLDPSHAPSKRSLGGPKQSPSMEELMNMQKQLEDLKRKGEQDQEGGPPGGPPGGGDMPPPPAPGGDDAPN